MGNEWVKHVDTFTPRTLGEKRVFYRGTSGILHASVNHCPSLIKADRGAGTPSERKGTRFTLTRDKYEHYEYGRVCRICAFFPVTHWLAVNETPTMCISALFTDPNWSGGISMSERSTKVILRLASLTDLRATPTRYGLAFSGGVGPQTAEFINSNTRMIVISEKAHMSGEIMRCAETFWSIIRAGMNSHDALKISQDVYAAV
jgi:hypothetical protein